MTVVVIVVVVVVVVLYLWVSSSNNSSGRSKMDIKEKVIFVFLVGHRFNLLTPSGFFTFHQI